VPDYSLPGTLQYYQTYHPNNNNNNTRTRNWRFESTHSSTTDSTVLDAASLCACQRLDMVVLIAFSGDNRSTQERVIYAFKLTPTPTTTPTTFNMFFRHMCTILSLI